MNFIHRGNDRLGLLVPIPRVKNYSTFDKMTKGQNWLGQIISFLNRENCEDETLYWMLKYVDELKNLTS